MIAVAVVCVIDVIVLIFLIMLLIMMIIIIIIRNLENIDEELFDIFARSQTERAGLTEIRDSAVQDFANDAFSAANFRNDNVAEDGTA